MCQTYPYEVWCSILWAGFENEMQEKRVIIEFESLHQSCCRRQLVFASGPQQPTNTTLFFTKKSKAYEWTYST